MRFKLALLVAGVILVGSGGAVMAKPKVQKKAPPKATKVLKIEGFEITGTVWKPWYMDITSKRLKIKYKGIPLKGDFLKKSLEPIDRNEF